MIKMPYAVVMNPVVSLRVCFTIVYDLDAVRPCRNSM